MVLEQLDRYSYIKNKFWSYYGLNCVPQIYMLKHWPPAPQDATTFDDGPCKVVMNSKETCRVGPTLIWLVSLQEEEMRTERTRDIWPQRKRPSQGAARRQPSVSQGERFQKKQNCRCFDLRLLGFRVMKTQISVL